ncbi:MAG: zinc-finger domain-containing protein [Rickettsiaceae bacterium]|nr:zinc-finger domain-containing protein [Rickettsiaceae bacterium]MDP4832485.1 zinc-finger domain-containing protein [Rickettsiaceae bacterium]MDP5020783.1 zinc-finger domain-containing protein [Rickettsiaceae bacterium]MDP5083315.1 zinc-finger domain-containing protein [Rickettsiaceae bacterium]
MQSIETEKTKSNSVSCKGKEAPYDHPKIYLEIDTKVGRIDCPYCSKIFVLDKQDSKS